MAAMGFYLRRILPWLTRPDLSAGTFFHVDAEDIYAQPGGFKTRRGL
jgi:hypothetical protein